MRRKRPSLTYVLQVPSSRASLWWVLAILLFSLAMCVVERTVDARHVAPQQVRLPPTWFAILDWCCANLPGLSLYVLLAQLMDELTKSRRLLEESKVPPHCRLTRRKDGPSTLPPPLQSPTPCNPPPPPPGDRHLAQKAQEIPGAEGAEESFSLGYTRNGGREDPCNLPPPPTRETVTWRPSPPPTRETITWRPSPPPPTQETVTWRPSPPPPPGRPSRATGGDCKGGGRV